MASKDFRRLKAIRSEDDFVKLCEKHGVNCERLDDLSSFPLREEFLVKPTGKCPDFVCSKLDRKVFVEIKTLTNLTNSAREKQLQKKNIESFDPLPELRGPFQSFLKDTSGKFKNIKDVYLFPRILFLDGVFGSREMIHAVFGGLYHSYEKPDEKLVYVGFRKTHRALFDSTGSSVSAVLWWNEEVNRFEALRNFQSKIDLSEEDFYFFFGESNLRSV